MVTYNAINVLFFQLGRDLASPTLEELHCKMRVNVGLLAYVWPHTENTFVFVE